MFWCTHGEECDLLAAHLPGPAQIHIPIMLCASNQTVKNEKANNPAVPACPEEGRTYRYMQLHVVG